MTWRQAAGAVLFSPVLAGMLLFIGAFVAWKLPMVCCGRLRAVRYLPLVGLGYYSVVVAGAALLGQSWWAVLGLAVAALGGECLLPDPLTFLFRPARRRAVVRAVEFIERQGGPRVLYGWAAVVGSEPARIVVSVAVETPYKPARRRFVAVGPDGSAEELGFGEVAAAYGVCPRR